MYIKQLKLQNVGKFNELTEFDFTLGFNVLHGANEAGKSTIVKAIETSLFGFKPIKDWKYANWQSQEAVIECILQRKDHELEITRKYGSKIRGTTRSGHVAENIGNQPIEGHLVDLELYKSMFSMTVDELAGIDKKSWKELSASLTDAYNHSAFKSAAEAQESVEHKASEIYKESGRGQYTLKSQQADHETYKAELKQLEIERAYAVRSESEKKDIQVAVNGLKKKIEILDDQIRHYEENHSRIKRRREYRLKLKDLQHLEALDLPNSETVSRWIQDIEREKQVLLELDRIGIEVERLDQRMTEMQDFYDHHRAQWPMFRTIFAFLLILGGAGYGIYSYPDGFFSYEQMITGFSIVLGIGLIANVGLVTQKKRKEDLGAYDHKMMNLSQSLSYAQMQRMHFEEEHDQMIAFREPLETLLLRTGLSGPDEVLQWVRRLEGLNLDLKRILEQEEDAEQFLLSVNSLSPENAPEELGLNALLNERDQCLQQKIEQEALLNHQTNLSVKEIDYRINEINEKIGLSHNQIMESAYTRDRLLLISKIVSEAEKLYRKSQKPDFLIRASRYMSLLTSGKYEEILMTESGGFVLKSGSDLIPMTETISRGTKEQMYLSLKLAMTFRLDPLGEYPILMDEIAINFDENRRSGLYKVLKELSEQRQVIYLTCHHWYLDEVKKALNTHVVELS